MRINLQYRTRAHPPNASEGGDIALRCPRPRWSGLDERRKTHDFGGFISSPDNGLGDKDGAARRPYQPSRGFTLIELILVMLLLIIAVSLVVPSLEKFFGGRSLDSEVRRFLALTHYSQSRAVSEGIPMLLWIDPKAGMYGLQQETGYTDGDEKAQEFTLGDGVSIGVASSKLAPGKRIGIRFSPDGSVLADGSVPSVFIKQGNAQVWIVQSADRLSYEVKS